MSEFKYEPSVADLIEAYAMSGDGLDFKRAANERREAAREALAAHDAEVRAGVVAEEPEWEYGIRAEGDDEPYTDHSDDPDWLCDQVTPEPGDAIVRRRKAGPWVPVNQEGAD